MSAVIGVVRFIGESFKSLIDGIKNFGADKKWGIYSGTVLLQLLITLVSGIVGIIVFHICGGYQGGSFFTNLKNMSFVDALDASFDMEAIKFMTSGPLLITVIVLCVIQVIIAVISNVVERPVRTIGAFVVFVGAIAVGLIMDEQPMVSALAMLTSFILFAIAVWKSEGGKMLLISAIAMVIHTMIMPMFMLAGQNIVNGLQVMFCAIFMLAVMIVIIPMVLRMVGASSNASSEGSYSSKLSSAPVPAPKTPAPKAEPNYKPMIDEICKRYCNSYKAITGSYPYQLDIKIIGGDKGRRAYDLWNSMRMEIKQRGLPLNQFPYYLR